MNIVKQHHLILDPKAVILVKVKVHIDTGMWGLHTIHGRLKN